MPIPVAATRSVHATGQTYAGPPANLIDGNPATTSDIYLTGSYQADWFVLDLGSAVAVGSVTLQNVTASVNPLAVWVSPDAAQSPDSSNPAVTQLTSPATNPAGAGTDYVYTATPAPTGRYLLVRQAFTNGPNSSATIGGASYVVAVGVVPAPTLTATPSLPGNVPSIILAGF